MLRMRLQRRGKKNYATYRVVVAEQRAPIKGRFVADLGFYNPHTDLFTVDDAKVKSWLARGVQPTPTVHNLLVTHDILKADKVTSWRPKIQQGEKDAQEAAETGKKPPKEAKQKSDEEKPDAEKPV